MYKLNAFRSGISVFGAVGIAAIGLAAPATTANAASILAACSNFPDNFAGQNKNSVVDVAPDVAISGPIGTDLACVDRSISTGTRLESRAKIESTSDFGASSSAYSEEGGSVLTNGNGRITTEITRQDINTTEIPFTISELTLEIQAFSRADVFFNFAILEKDPNDPDPLAGLAIREVEGKFSLTDRGVLDIQATDQIGFQAAFTQSDNVPIAIQGPNGTVVRDSATHKAVLATYSSALDISDLTVGKEYILDYIFSTTASGRFAKSVFQDPINLSSGGIDPVVLAGLTSSTVPTPSPVPLPAGAVFLLTGLLSLMFGTRRRSGKAA